MNFLNTLRYERNLFFTALGMRRLNRILTCSFVIASIWCFADFQSGNLQANYLDDLICFGMGTASERLLPWGKPQAPESAASGTGNIAQ